jgi:hypothetical protein
MPAVKRKKENESQKLREATPKKRHKAHNGTEGTAIKKSRTSRNEKRKIIAKSIPQGADLIESDTTESENGFFGFSAKDGAEDGPDEAVDQQEEVQPKPKIKSKTTAVMNEPDFQDTSKEKDPKSRPAGIIGS